MVAEESLAAGDDGGSGESSGSVSGFVVLAVLGALGAAAWHGRPAE